MEPHNLAVSCITRSVLRSSADRPAGSGFLTFSQDESVRLSGRHRLSFGVLQSYGTLRAVEGWATQTTSCLYHVFAGDRREIVAFHLHDGNGAAGAPHAHFRQLNDPIPMGKVHVPTGWISLPTVVRFLIEELAVEPLRPDWSEVLGEAERAVEAPARR